jgi:vitamin B12 transporter
VWIIAKQEEEVKAGYLQVRTTDDLWTNTRFAAGARQNETGGSSNTVGNISGEHYFTDNLFIEAIWGTSFVLPSAEDLYLADPCCGWHGNPNLEAEESRGIDYGIGGLFSLGSVPLNWKVSGWSRKVDNLIDWDDAATLGITVPPGFTVTSYNRNGETKVSGWDVIFRGPITDSLSFSYNYTRSKEENGGVQLRNRPSNNQKAALTFSPPGSFYGINLAAKYVGEAMITGTSEKRDSYMVANLGAHLFLDSQGLNHRLNLRVENLFDDGYATRYYTVTREDNGLPQLVGRLGPSRTYTLSYAYEF